MCLASRPVKAALAVPFDEVVIGEGEVEVRRAMKSYRANGFNGLNGPHGLLWVGVGDVAW